MPLFTEDINDNSKLPGTPVHADAYTGPVQRPIIPSYFEPGSPGPSSGNGEDNGALTFQDVVNGLSNQGINPATPNEQASYASIKAYGSKGRYRPGIDYEDINAQNQSGWDRVANAGVQLVNKVGSYLTQAAGFVLGSIPAVLGGGVNYLDEWMGGKGKIVNNGNAVSLMTDNFLTKVADVWKEAVQDVHPIYKPYNYTHGDIWDKLNSRSWWLDDAIDRLALTGSMIIPGVLQARGVGLFGAVVDEAGVLNATGVASKGIQALSENPELYGKIGKLLGSSIYKVAATGEADVVGARALAFKNAIQTAQKLELYGWNVTGQAALNGREAQVSIRKALHEQREAGLNNLSEEQIEDLAAEGAAKGFWYSAPLALTASLVELPQIFSTAKMAKSVLAKAFSKETGQMLENALTQTVRPSWWKIGGKMLLTGLEHGQNESAQVAIGRYLEASIAGETINGKVVKDEDNPLAGITKYFIDNVNDPNGQNNIALGTIQGFLMTLGGHAKSTIMGEYAKTDAQNRKYIELVNQAQLRRRFWTTPENFIERDEADPSRLKIGPDGKVVFNQTKLAEMGMSAIGAAEAYAARQKAVQENDTFTLNRLNFNSLTALAKNFFDDPQGMEYLTNVLRFEASNQKSNINRVNDVINGVEQTPDVQLAKNLEHIQTLKRAYDAVENRRSFIRLDINSQNKDEVVARGAYIENQKNAQYFNAADQIFLNDRIRQNDTELATLGISEFTENPTSPEQQRANDIIKEQEENLKELDELKDDYKVLVDPTKFKERFNIQLEQYRKAKEIIANKQEELAREAERRANMTPEELAEENKVKIKTKDGENEYEIGKEYYVGKVIEYDKDGNEVYRFPTMTILKDNGDGTIRIRDSKGNERDIEKSKLEDYKLGSVEAVENNENASFYLRNINDIVYWNTGKNKSGKIPGRLVYDSKADKLYFAYKQNGKVKQLEIGLDSFKPKEGYSEGVFSFAGPDGKTRTLTADDIKNIEDRQESGKTATDQASRRSERFKVLSELHDETATKLDNTRKLLSRKYAEFEKITDDLSEIEEKIKKGGITKKLNFKRTTAKAIQAANRLSRMQEDLRKEIEGLETEQQNLESLQSYVEDIRQNLDELPTDSKEFLNELRDQVLNLGILQEETGRQINSMSKLIDQTEGALNKAMDFVKELINKFEKTYPKTPTNIIGQEWINFLQANPNFLKINTNFKEDLATVEDIISQIDDLDIIPGERTVAELRDSLNEMMNTLAEVERELAAKDTILAKFENYVAEYNRIQEEEAAVSKNEELIKAIIGTLNKTSQNLLFDTKYEADPKKADSVVSKATTFATERSEKGEAPAEHHQRANRFGARFAQIKSKGKNIRGIIVTANNESAIIPGLTEFLKQGKEGVDASTTIALVMAEKGDDGVLHLVDENGERISKEDALDKGIFQVFPLDIKDMFRAGTEKYIIDGYSKQFQEWRTKQLENPEIVDYNVTASFGIPENVTTLNDKGEAVQDYNARIPVEESGLISQADLAKNPMIYLPTLESDITLGTTSFRNALGGVFLRLANGYVKLNNRQHTAKEASAIYDAVYRLSAIMARDKNIKSEEAQRLVDWLRTVVFWGVPKEGKNPGYNAMWFAKGEDGKLKLFMSGKNQIVSEFTPSQIELNKGNITTLLQEMYNNTHSMLVDTQWKQPYEQIVSISKDGTIERVMWPNYQTYLLSNKQADGKTARSVEDIPLSTRMRPLKNATDVNKRGIYFIIDDAANDASFIRPEAPQKVTAILSPGAPKAQAPAAKSEAKAATTAKFVLDGTTENTITLKSGTINFVYDPTTPDTFKNIDISKEAIDSVIASQKEKGITITEDEAFNILSQYTLKQITADTEATTVSKEAGKSAIMTPTLNFVLDGKTENTITLQDGSQIKFVFNENQVVEPGKLPAIKESKIPQNKIDELAKSKNITKEEAANAYDNYILKQIEAFQQSRKQAEAPKVEEKKEAPVSDIKVKTPIEGLNERLDAYGNAKVVLPSDFYEGERPKGRLNAFQSSLSSVADNLIILADLNLNEFTFLSESDKKRLDALRPLAEELRKINTNDISSAERRTVAVEKRYAQLTNQLANEFVDIVGKHVEQQLDKTITSSKPKLSALEEKPVERKPAIIEAPKSADQVSDEIKRRIAERKGRVGKDVDLRMFVENQAGKFERENWNDVEKAIREMFPNVPVYRVKNMLKGANGVQAWGMLKDGALYIYENAEVGTAYHEIFEAVWKMVTPPAEQAAVRNEFRNREGSFVDRPTGQTIKYSEATDQQLKEQLAEEFRDYVHEGKVPPKPKDGRPFIVKLFADLVNMIKNLFLGKAGSKAERLFKNIEKGKYKSYIPSESSLSFANKGIIDIENAYITEGAELREFPGLTNENVHDAMQQMTFVTLSYLMDDNYALFNIPDLNKQELYTTLKDNLLDRVVQQIVAAEDMVAEGKFTQQEVQHIIDSSEILYQNIENNWEALKEKHEEYLKTYSIEFDENDDIALSGDEKSKEDPYGEANKIDHFRKANSAVKLVLATLPMVDSKGNRLVSSVGGVKLIPLSEAYMAVINNVHNAINEDAMIEGIRQMAIADKNYERLYSRLTKSPSTTNAISWDGFNQYDLKLLTSFLSTFNKQNPDVKLMNILAGGEVQITDSNFSTAARQAKNDFVNDIRSVIKGTNSFFEYSKKENGYVKKIGKDKKDPFDKYILNSPEARISFLKDLGIVFSKDDVRALEMMGQVEKFNKAVAGILASMKAADKIATISGSVLNIDGRLLSLGEMKAKLDNPEFSSTYYGAKGEKIQTYMGTNPSSDLYKALSSIKNIKELETDPRYKQYSYLATDSFAKNSVILKAMFEETTGDRISGTDNLMKSSLADGYVNLESGKRRQSSRQNYKERLTQEINMNLDGYYYNLVPGDASMEWMTYMGNHISESVLKTGWESVHDVFRGYLIDEINLAREQRNIVTPKGTERKTTDLRFFKSIFENKDSKKPNEVHNEIVKLALEKNKNGEFKYTPEEIYSNNKNKVDSAIEKYIKNETESFKNTLSTYSIIAKTPEDTYITSSLKFAEKNEISVEDLNRNLNALTANFMINNIELHKLIYSDPYQYSDELKRIKNFLSPRQNMIHGSTMMNAALDRVWNVGFEPTDIGYTDMTKDYFTSTTLADIYGTHDLDGYRETLYKETDGSGIMIFKAYRNFRIRTNDWNEAEERQYRHDVEYEKLVNSGADERTIAKFEQNNPGVQSAYTARKPIVAGNKANGKSYNDVMLDKFAIYPLSFRIMHKLNSTANSLKLYDKMQKEGIDYVVFDSGRKVGAEGSNQMYDKSGAFTTAPFEGMINVPFAIMSVQSEVPSKEVSLVTRGTQATKEMTMDFMDAGVPVDFLSDGKNFNERYQQWIALPSEEAREEASPLYKEIKNNQKLLNEMMEVGYQNLLNRLGMKDVDGKIEITEEGKTKAAQTLRDEILKREVNDNIADALIGFLNGDVVLEATPAYQQIRNILYSIADKEVISPKISGRMLVQIPSTFLESNRIEAVEINGKQAYASDVLKFYVDDDGKRVCEMMIGRWFDSNKTDEQLLEYFNETPEGQEILKALAFRIPTQKENSFESIKIAKFLPKEFGDNIVVPSALVQKAGSDFDIDKLTTYLKNVYEDGNGNIKLVPFYGFGEAAKSQFEKMYDAGEFLTKSQMQELDRIIEEERDILSDTSSAAKLMISVFKDSLSEEAITKDFVKRITKESFKKEFINNLYKKSLENGYIESSINLVSSKENFSQLIKPNSADQLKGLAEEITKLRGIEGFDYSAVGNMLSRGFMSRLRHAFVSGKYAIGIAAVSQTNHSLNQRQPIYFDFNRINLLDDKDAKWLYANGMQINFVDKKGNPLYNTMQIDGKTVPTLSMIKNVNGEYISDIVAQFIDGYVDISKGPWIMELGATPNVASTFLMLAKVGVPIDTVSYFMNQPIIRDYLRSVETSGYSYLFMEQYVNAIKNSLEYKEGIDQLDKVTAIPDNDSLKKSIKAKKLSPLQKAEQIYMLDEFLKYAKMAEQLFTVTQGTNFDTSNFNDPYLVFKKLEQLKKAQNTIISSPDSILENSFLGPLAKKITDIRNAMSEIITSDRGDVRNILENVLREYVDLPDREFVQVAQKAVNDFFDWTIQVNDNKNTFIEKLLMSDNDSGAKKVADLKKEIASNKDHALYNNYLVGKNGILETQISDKDNGVNNLSIKNKGNKVYDQNQIIYSFREIKKYVDENTYKTIVGTAILQSGLSNSRISFTSLLPYEDFKKTYNETLSNIKNLSDVNINDFYTLGVFERNNWADDDIVPRDKANAPRRSPMGRLIYNTRMNWSMSKEDRKIGNAINEGKIPKLLKVSNLSRVGNSNFVVYSWENMAISKADKVKMKQAGDYSYINKGLFKKVYYPDRTPVTTSYIDKKTGEERVSYVYKMINAWGDSFRANEFYNTERPSVIDNGFMKVEETSSRIETPFGIEEINTSSEKSDDIVSSYFSRIEQTPIAKDISPSQEKTVSLQTKEISEKDMDLKSPADTESLLLKMGAKKVSKGALNIDGQHWYLDSKYWKTLGKQGRTELFLYPNPDAPLMEIEEIYVGKAPTGSSKFTTDSEYYKKYGEPLKDMASIAMQPDNIAKIKDGSKTITNRTEYLKDGEYKLPDGTPVKLSFVGQYKYSSKTDSVQPTDQFGGARPYDKNSFAQAEGFKDWADFEKNNKYSTNFINGTQSRYVYSIEPVVENNIGPKGKPQIKQQNTKKCG